MSDLGKEVYRTTIGETTIIVYQKNPEATFLSPYAQLLVQEISGNNMIRIFTIIEIVLEANKMFSRSLEAGIFAAKQKNRLAYVEMDEIRQGRVIVHIDEDSIVRGVVEKFKDDELRSPKIRSLIIPNSLKRAKKAVIHELTHIWHLTINDTERKIERNSRRLRDATEKTIERNDLFPGKLEESLRKHWEKEQRFDLVKLDIASTLQIHWEDMRQSLLIFLQDIIHEGAAMFMEEWGHGILFIDSNAEHHYERADSHAFRIDCALFAHFRTLERLIKLLYDTPSPDIKKIKQTMANIRGIDSEIYKTKEFLRSAPYIIGPHIFQFIAMYAKIPIEKMFLLDYARLLEYYEKACSNKGVKPVVSLQSGKGTFSYRKYVTELHRLRKEAKRLSGV